MARASCSFDQTKFVSVDVIARHTSSLINKVPIQERGLDVALIRLLRIQAQIEERN